jgi:hypothetical protein
MVRNNRRRTGWPTAVGVGFLHTGCGVSNVLAGNCTKFDVRYQETCEISVHSVSDAE